MTKQTQKMIMFIALGAALATLVFYFSGQLKFVEMLEGEESDDEIEEGMDGEPLPMGDSDSESDEESDEEA